MVNIFGPGHSAGTRETTSRPAKVASGKASDTWFAPCVNGDPNTGTVIEHQWLNYILASLRRLVRTAGAVEDEISDDMPSEAAARYASGGQVFACGGSSNAYVLTAKGQFIVPTSPFDGQLVVTIPNHTNTGSATATWSGVTKAIRTFVDGALAGGELVNGRPTVMIYSPTANSGAGALLIMPWAVPGVGGPPPTEAGGGRWDMWRARLASDVTGITNNATYTPVLSQDGAASFGSYSAGVFTFSRAGFYHTIGGTDGNIFTAGVSTYFNATWIERNGVMQSRNTANGYCSSVANPTANETSCVVSSAAFHDVGDTLKLSLVLNAAVPASGHTLFAGRQTFLAIIPLPH